MMTQQLTSVMESRNDGSFLFWLLVFVLKPTVNARIISYKASILNRPEIATKKM